MSIGHALDHRGLLVAGGARDRGRKMANIRLRDAQRNLARRTHHYLRPAVGVLCNEDDRIV